MELRTALSQLTEAIAQMGNSGNSEHIKRVRGLLTDFKREVYRLLSEQIAPAIGLWEKGKPLSPGCLKDCRLLGVVKLL